MLSNLDENLLSTFEKSYNKLFVRIDTSETQQTIHYKDISLYTGCAKKKKDILNIHIKSEGINIFSQKFCWTESTIFVVKCQKITFIVQLFMTYSTLSNFEKKLCSDLS